MFRAAALKPDLEKARRNLRTAYNDVIPAWHFAMMNDRPRNDAYQAAIARLVKLSTKMMRVCEGSPPAKGEE
jgi:type II protein arginine methyltransferase